LLEKRWLY